ncbi:MAG: nucleoside deaminase [Magnetococcus sp. DMHC-6]
MEWKFLEADRSAQLLALVAATEGGGQNEIPVGAVICAANGKILAYSPNQSLKNHDPIGHAEIRVLRQAAQRMENYRLSGAVLTVSLQPCPMCLFAANIARINKINYLAQQFFPNINSQYIEIKNKSSYASTNQEDPMTLAAGNLLRFFFEKKRAI